MTPVLAVALDDAALVDALANDDLPVLTLHAPLKSAPDQHREWRLAAAHYRDAATLRAALEAVAGPAAAAAVIPEDEIPKTPA